MTDTESVEVGTSSADTAHHQFTIFVNGKQDEWSERNISYAQLVNLAFPHGSTGTEVRYTVSWTKPDGTEGTLRPGEKVRVVDQMIFDVRNTYKS